MRFPEIPGPWPHEALHGRVLRLDADAFSVDFHSDWAHFIDPRLQQTLAPWGIVLPEDVPRWRRYKVEGGRVLGVSLDHSWAIAAWARAGAGEPLTVVHLDRHADCGAPLLLLDGAGEMQDCLTGAPARASARTGAPVRQSCIPPVPSSRRSGAPQSACRSRCTTVSGSPTPARAHATSAQE